MGLICTVVVYAVLAIANVWCSTLLISVHSYTANNVPLFSVVDF